jgi:RNA polymerase sigma factor (sigma-70 family)
MGQLHVADSGPTDEALLAGMAVREEAAAVVFVRRYQGRVYGLAYSMTSDATLAEEVAQESLIRVWRHAPVFDPRRGSVTSWVLTITRNLTIDALRMRRAVPTDPDDFAASALMNLDQIPEEAGQQDNARAMVRTALLKLSPEQRRAVVLAGAYGRTALEISEEEGIPLGTAKTRIRTGLMRLRSTLEHTGGSRKNDE